MTDHAWDGFLGAILGAIVGGVIAGVTSLIAIKLQLGSERKLRDQESAAKQKAILAAIYHELNASWDYYMFLAGKVLEDTEENGIFKYTIAVSDNLYVIYDANAQYLGDVADFALTKKIITVYVQLKTLAESYKMHNAAWESYSTTFEECKLHGDTRNHQMLQSKTVSLVHATRWLKESHNKVKPSIAELLTLLRTYTEPQKA